jgi:uncharacterized membrane protein YidH (DUF202 family)
MMDIKPSDLTLWGWLLFLATIGVVIFSAFQIASLVPQDCTHVAEHARELLALPAVGVGAMFFALGASALNRAGRQVVRRRTSKDSFREPPNQ